MNRNYATKEILADFSKDNCLSFEIIGDSIVISDRKNTFKSTINHSRKTLVEDFDDWGQAEIKVNGDMYEVDYNLWRKYRELHLTVYPLRKTLSGRLATDTSFAIFSNKLI